jgi:hypothetical protein
MRFAFCRPRMALATTTPDITAVVASWALRDSVARDIHDDMSAIRSSYLYGKTRRATIGNPSAHKGRARLDGSGDVSGSVGCGSEKIRRTDGISSEHFVAMNSVDASKTFLTRRPDLWTLDI